MGRRADHSRGELHELFLDAATALVDREGLAGLSARSVARAIGYSVGTIYNLFEDLDDLTWQLNGRTLDALQAHLAGAARDVAPEARVRQLAQSYLDFVSARPRRWAAVLEMRPREGGEPPGWYRDRIRGLFDLAEDALAAHFPAGESAARRRSAHVLWAGLSGIALLIETASLPADTDPADLVASLVDTHLAGIARNDAGRRPAARRGRADAPGDD